MLDSTVSGNSVGGDGGGIHAATATLARCTLNGNTALHRGGGIYVDTATFTDSTISNNFAGTRAGGGICAGTVSLTNCTVSGNASGNEGGGIYAGVAKLTNSTISGNSAPFSGGIYAAWVTLIYSTVSHNTRFNGGGINAFTAELIGSTVSGNFAGQEGGGIVTPKGYAINCTIVENFARSGGGIRVVPGGAFTVRNTIIALNLTSFARIGPDVMGQILSQGHNLIGDGTGGFGFFNSDMVGTAANPIDPKLGPLADNGGPTMTHALLAGSLAIDHGDNASITTTDQRGATRRRDGNGDGIAIVDIGAFER